MSSVALFTRDLRLADNPVLTAAGRRAIPLFVQDPDASVRHGSPNRSAFLAESLRDLDTGLRTVGSSLVVRTGRLAEVVATVVGESGADSVHIGRDVSAFAQRRLAQLEQALSVPVETHNSITVIPPDAIAPASGPFYQVFTPYYRSWSEVHRRTVLDAPMTLSEPGIDSEPLPEIPTVGTSPARLSGGETEARRRLHDWLPRVRAYGDTRDALAEDGTSMLSADLHLGTLSPLEVSLAASEAGA
ncbi:MAG: deoxyribodipyrimidine photo-lyase, partial [Acidimicrobiia bacterium]|nr:deoxyribodipyrimidine photo-lyase [Acidimicrobiia bacterium]